MTDIQDMAGKPLHVMFLFGHQNTEQVQLLNSYLKIGYEVERVTMGGQFMIYLKEADKEPVENE